MNADPRVVQYLPKPLNREESDQFAARIQKSLSEREFGLWAVEVKDTADFIGFTGLAVPRFEAHFTPCVEIGWRLSFNQWGKGYATEAASAALLHAFISVGLEEVVSFTVPANQRSIAVMKRLRMTSSSSDDFVHPSLPTDHPLRFHVLYRINRSDWMQSR
jgi:RimJ/RimL family protein N-acetyltransferase